MLFETLSQEAEDLNEKLIQLRRDFHMYPELAWEEMRTSAQIARYLTNLGFDEVMVGEQVCLGESRMALPRESQLEASYERAQSEHADPEFLPATRGGHTGVIGILKCGDRTESSPVIAFRFDIDALPIKETTDLSHFPTQEAFASRHEGVMHACGHDGHITVGLGTAELLARHRGELTGTIKFIFQPAEEGVRGAKSIADHHHLDDVDYLVGSHMSDISTVKNIASRTFIGLGPGGSLATTKIDATFTGLAAHAAMTPNKGNNALLAAATAIQNLHAIPRYADAATRVNVGKITGGTARNIICDNIRLELEVRGETTEANNYMETYARRILESAAAMHGCNVEISLMGSAKSVVNDAILVDKIHQTLTDQIHAMHLQSHKIEEKMSGSEDYSYLSDAVQSHGGQSCYFNNFVPCAGPFHSTHFDFDERALVNGVKAFTAIATGLLRS